MSKHTPGPWVVTCCADYVIYREGWTDDDIPIAICGDIRWTTGENRTAQQREMEANARLIARAPEMQATIDRLRGLLGEWNYQRCWLRYSDAPPCGHCLPCRTRKELEPPHADK